MTKECAAHTGRKKLSTCSDLHGRSRGIENKILVKIKLSKRAQCPSLPSEHWNFSYKILVGCGLNMQIDDK